MPAVSPGPVRSWGAHALAWLHWGSGILMLAGFVFGIPNSDWLAGAFLFSFPTCLLSGFLYLIWTSRWPGGAKPDMELARFLATTSVVLLGVVVILILANAAFWVD